MPVNLVFCKLKTAVLFCEEFTWRESSFLETQKRLYPVAQHSSGVDLWRDDRVWTIFQEWNSAFEKLIV